MAGAPRLRPTVHRDRIAPAVRKQVQVLKPFPKDNRSGYGSQIFLFWSFAVALPVSVLFNVEVWLQSSYTGGLFHLQGFLSLYNTGIFRYRLLGRILLLHAYGLLLHVIPHTPFPMPRDPVADLPFVLAYAVLNGICLLLANFLLLRLMWIRGQGFRTQDLPFYLFTFLLMSVSLAVVTPYDQLAYLLLVLPILGARSRHAPVAYAVVVASAIAGTLNRETEFLVSALLITLALFSPVQQTYRYLRLGIVHLVVCLFVYVLLRVAMPGEPALTNSILTFGGKWAPAAALFVVTLFLTALTLARSVYASLRPAWIFMLFSTPYLSLVILTGVLRELRLLVPIVLCVFCLSLVLSQEDDALTA